MPQIARTGAALAGLAVALTWVSSAAPQRATPPPYTGRIVFEGGLPDSGIEIFTMNADGSRLRKLTRNGEGDRSPRWSPDGGRIAFVREIFAKRSDVYVMKADGSGAHKLARRRALSSDPDWSPDGRRIAFASSDKLGSRRFDVHLVDFDGTHERELLRRAESPAWSPDGQKIAFVRRPNPTRSDDSSIYIASADGSAARRITGRFSDDPAWSPDGRRIAFASGLSGAGDIYVMRTNGTGLRRLTHGGDVDGEPTWSPDGTRIAFARFGIHNGLFSVNLATKRLRRMTSPGYAGQPHWIAGPD